LTPEAWVLKQRIHERPEVAVARFLARFIAGHSIRSLTYLVTVCVTAPVLALVLYLGQQYVVEKKGEVAVRAMELARLFSQRHGDMVLQARTLLETLACQPNLVDIPANQLHAQFLRIAKANPQYAHLSLAGPDGLLIASSASTDAVIDYNDRMQFRGAIREKRFVVGEAVVSRTTGQPILPFGVPVIGPDGGVAGVLLLGLLLDEYDRFFAGLRLSEGVRFLLFDVQGTRLLRYPGSDGAPAGQQLFPPAWEVIAKAAEDVMTFSMKDPAGRDVTYACIRFRVGPGEGGRLGVLAGIPTPGFADLFWPVYGRSLLLVLAAMAVSIVLGGVLTDRVVGVGLETLTREVDQVAAGKYPPMPVSLAGCREVQALGASFLVMADALARDQEARDLAERSLLAESLRFKTVLEAATDSVYVLDTEGTLVLWSPSFAEMLGYSMEEMAGMRICDWDMQCSGSEWSPGIQAVIENQIRFETRYRRKDGATLDVEVRARGVALDGRKFLYASARDVTERKQAEQRYRELFEHAPIGIFQVTPDGRYAAANSRLAEMYGYGSVRELQDTVQHVGKQLFVDPGEFEALLRTLDRMPVVGAEGCRRRKDGATIWVSLSVRAVRDTAGSVQRYEGFVVDISAVKQAQEALRESEERYRAFFESVESIKLILEPADGAIMEANQAAVDFYGYNREQLLRMAMPHLNAEPREDFLARMARAATQEKTIFHLRHRLANGDIRDMESYVSPVRHGGRLLVMCSLQDVTELRRLERVREDVERIIRHDLKSPLNGLINIPLLLLEGKNLNAEQREMLAVVATAGRKMLNQINSSLEMYKIESASYRFQPTPCAPVKILRDNAALLTLSMGLDADRIRLWTHGLGGTGEVASFQSDPVLLDLIMMNLLRNALEASGPQEPVLVDVSTDDGMLVISIANSQSVPQEMRQCFFEKYTTAGKVGGTGLGTYSAAIMTHAIGGVITMETSETHGTKVTVRLPLTPTPADGSL
jgi:PAS domain S-box-containing protein